MATRDNPGATAPRESGATTPREPGTTTSRDQVTMPEQQTRTSAVHDELRDEATSPGSRRDRIRWGAIWAGALTVLPVFMVLQLLFYALGLLDFAGGAGAATTLAIVSGVLALIAFFIGGLLAGASTMWRGTPDGLLHGVLVWALSVLGLLALSMIGEGSLFGPLAQGGVMDQQVAGWNALGLGLSVAAAALGGTLGAKMWPGRNQGADAR